MLIHVETCTAPTNIACIKYWGKSSIPHNTPLNPSISLTLSQQTLRAQTTSSASLSYTHNRLWLNGVEEDVKGNTRFEACVDGCLKLAQDRTDPVTKEVLIRKEDWTKHKFHISSMNTFPTAAGLASSAAGYAALVASLAKLMCCVETYEGELTTIARRGSGSACRSMYGGFVAWRKGDESDDWKNSIAEHVCDESHWGTLRTIICVVSDKKKTVSSTNGMVNCQNTSQLLSHRTQQLVEPKMKLIEEAYKNKNFQVFAEITMQDSNQFHATCLDSYPPLFYLTSTSQKIISIIHTYNEFKTKVCAGYTFDAGPNAVVVCEEKDEDEVLALLVRYFPVPRTGTGKLGSVFGFGSESEEGGGYVSDETRFAAAKSYTLDAELIKACDLKYGAPPSSSMFSMFSSGQREVKNMYITKVGPGPQMLGVEDSLIDLETGLNNYYAASDIGGGRRGLLIGLGVFGAVVVGVLANRTKR